MSFNFSRWSLITLFQYKAKIKREPITNARVSNPYHAVSVVPGHEACRHAVELEGVRFLSAEAPRLPLPKCDVTVCKCRYRHHPDRRSGEPRRETDLGIVSMEGKWQGVDRRRRRGRRTGD